MLVLGTVPYANAAPLVEGLDAAPGVRLVREVPAVLARRLASGELDAALVPSAALHRDAGPVLVPGACLSSRGPVRSVSLFGRRAPAPGGRVLLDPSSVTSAALARVLLPGPLACPGASFAEGPPGADPRTADADQVLLIGDPALLQDRRGLVETDLGEAWTRWTGLPFVWAVWAARDGAAARAAEPVLREARDRGARALPAIVDREAARLRLERGFVERYFTVHIRYGLGEDERRALARFREECLAAG